jgi:hypothetical protein
VTTVQDSITYADGTLASGQIVLTWPPFVWSGVTVTGGQKAFTIAPDGTISIPCYPTVGAQPPTVYYTANYQLDRGAAYSEYWAVPPSPPVVTIGAIRTIPEMPQYQ